MDFFSSKINDSGSEKKSSIFIDVLKNQRNKYSSFRNLAKKFSKMFSTNFRSQAPTRATSNPSSQSPAAKIHRRKGTIFFFSHHTTILLSLK